jgi:hypothetical protein
MLNKPRARIGLAGGKEAIPGESAMQRNNHCRNHRVISRAARCVFARGDEKTG